MLLQLTLALVLLALPGSLQQDGDCTESKVRDVRLRGGTTYAGHVQVCWGKPREYPIEYKWWSVCSNMWGIDEARAACSKLNFNNSITTGTLKCGQRTCFGSGDVKKVKLSCPDLDQPCNMDSVGLSICYDDMRPAAVVCDLSPLEEDISSTSQPCDPNTAALCPSTSQESSAGESSMDRAMQRSCDVLGGVMGTLIIAMVIVLVGTNLGWVWLYQRRSGKQRIEGETEVPKEAHLSNPTYDVPTYDLISPPENHRLSVSDNPPQPYGPAPSSSGTYDTTEHNQHHLKNGRGNVAYHSLEGGTSVLENTDSIYHVLVDGEEGQDQNYSMINRKREEGELCGTPLDTEATLTIDNEYGRLQHN